MLKMILHYPVHWSSSWFPRVLGVFPSSVSIIDVSVAAVNFTSDSLLFLHRTELSDGSFIDEEVAMLSVVESLEYP